MTEQSRHWDGISLGDATLAPYSASEWADQERLEHSQGSTFPNYGVFAGTGDGIYQPLQVQAKSPASTNIEIEVGCALVHGYLYENTAALTFTIGSNSSGNARIDTVILRADMVAQTVRAVVKQGTPAASPARPTLQQDTSVWEIPLADINVANGFSTLPQSTIIQRQRAIGALGQGWQPYVYPLNYAFGSTIGTGVSLAPGTTILIPFILSGNLLLDTVRTRTVGGTGQAYDFGWDLYKEDVNDGNTAENIIRRVAQSDGDATGTLSIGTDLLTLNALARPVPLIPGAYYLAWQNRHASNSIQIDSSLGNAFDAAAIHNRAGVTSIPNGQQLDVVATFLTPVQNALCVRMHGRTFGKSTIF